WPLIALSQRTFTDACEAKREGCAYVMRGTELSLAGWERTPDRERKGTARAHPGGRWRHGPLASKLQDPGSKTPFRRAKTARQTTPGGDNRSWGAMDRDPFGLLGRVLDGKFRVDAVVGDGDLSVVYKGYHLELH